MADLSARGIAKAYRFPLILLASVCTGALVGLYMGPRAVVLKPLGDLFLNLMFTVVVPLVFFSVAGAVAASSGAKRLGKVFGTMLLVFALTGICSSIMMLIGVTLYPPAQGLDNTLPPGEMQQASTAGQLLVNTLTVPDFRDLLSRRSMFQMIVFAVLVGLACLGAGDAGRRVATYLADFGEVCIKLVGILMYAAPVGLGAYFASLTGEYGPQLLGTYARAMVVYHVVAVVYFAVFFTLYAWLAGGGWGVRTYWRRIVTPAFTAIATCSSVATIPFNLKASREIGVPRDVRELVVPMGATMHMDGSCLSAIMKIAVLCGIFGIPFDTPGAFAVAIGVAILSGVGMAGIPGGGLVGEMMIVTLYGFPPAAFPLLATLGNLVDPFATMVNSTGDTLAGMLVARFVEGRDWMKHAPEVDEDAAA